MAATVVGTPTAVASGGSYTRGAGSNRLVVMVARAKAAPSVTLTNISYNSITRTPTVTGRDNAGGDRDTVAICIFKESELPAGAATVTATWSAATAAESIMCYTVDGADQTTTVRSSVGNFGNGTNPLAALTGLTISDLCIAGSSMRSGAGGAGTINNGWTKDDDLENGDGGRFVSAHKTAASTTETYSITATDTDDWAAAAVGIIPAGAASTTITPGVGSVVLQGRTPTTSAFINVRIREVLVNESGQVVGGAANIILCVWYAGHVGGAPDVSLNGMTTDAAGTTSWSIATGTLAYNQPIFYVAQDSLSYSNYTCARMIPSYE